MMLMLAVSCGKKDDNGSDPVLEITGSADVTEKSDDTGRENGNNAYSGNTEKITDTAPDPESSGNNTEPEKYDNYTFVCRDSSGAPVKGIKLQICTDEICTMKVSDDNGEIIFDGEPLKYTVHVYSYSDGYSLVSEKDFETEAEYGIYYVDFR